MPEEHVIALSLARGGSQIARGLEKVSETHSLKGMKTRVRDISLEG